LLDNYELGLFAGRFLVDLERIYRTLEEIDPINMRILEGLNRVCMALGKAEDVAALQSKIQSLQGMSGRSVDVTAQAPEVSFDEPDYFGGQTSDESEFGEVSFADINTDFEEQHDSGTPDVSSVFDGPDDELEIEVEFDDEVDFEIPMDTTDVPEDDWLGSVDAIFDTIAAKPRGVKFASGLDGDDAQSHYDLGLAFREMGLHDEAINEFRQASTDTSRRLECIILQGACLRDKGDLANAEKVLITLMKPALGLDDACSVKYELALTYEADGKMDQFLKLLTEIDASNSGFRDVRERIVAAGRGQNSLDFSDDELKGFELK
jgi:tetratricopeptide (TPR) repeat protein